MPRSKNDPFKRKCAQALNHAAAAILDVNEVYEAFETQRDMLEKNITQGVALADPAALERYTKMAADLKTIMLGIHACREHLILFTMEAWGLDEESIRVYMG